MSELISLFFGMMMFFTAIGFLILIYAVFCLGRMRMFQKAGVAGWKAWIPLYRDYVLCQITMGKGWYFVLGLIPPLYPVMQVLYALEICLSYKMEILFGVLYFFLPWLAELIVGFGKYEYQGSQDLDQQIRNIFGGTGPQNGQNGGASGTQAGGAQGSNSSSQGGASQDQSQVVHTQAAEEVHDRTEGQQ